MYPPPMISCSHEIIGGAYDLQMFSLENVIEFSQDPGGPGTSFCIEPAIVPRVILVVIEVVASHYSHYCYGVE